MAISRNIRKVLGSHRGEILPKYVKEIAVTTDREREIEIANVKIKLWQIEEWLSQQATSAIWWVKAGVTAAVIGAVAQIIAVILTLTN